MDTTKLTTVVNPESRRRVDAGPPRAAKYLSRQARAARVRFAPWVSLLEERTLLSFQPTSTAVIASTAVAVYGQEVKFTANVSDLSPGTAVPTGGTVTFFDGSATLGSSPLDNGVATLSDLGLGAGTHAVTAAYSGDGALFSPSDSTGTIITAAGNGTSNTLDFPEGVAVDPAGDIFVADAANNRVREVVKATGAVITVAGTGSAGYSGDGGPATAAMLNFPYGVAVDSAGDLFVADLGNQRVREVLANGTIETVAGNGTAGYGGDGGSATAAMLDNPEGLALDASGNLFIADVGNNRVREVLSSGMIITVAGTGTAGYNGDGGPASSAELNFPNGVAVDASGDLFIADRENERVREVLSNGTIETIAGDGDTGYSGDGGPATAATLNEPTDIAVDQSGDVFISDRYNERVREIEAATGNIITIAGTGALGYGGDGGAAAAAAFDEPTGLALDEAGDLFIADASNNRVREIIPAATVVVRAVPTDTAVTASTASASYGQTVTFTATVSASAPSTAAPIGGTVTFSDGGTILGTGPLVNGVSTLPDVVLGLGLHTVTASYSGEESLFLASSSGTMTTVAGDGTFDYSGDGGPSTAATFSYPEGVAVDAAGDIFVADIGNYVVREVVKATGDIITVAGTPGQAGYSGDGGPATEATLGGPVGLAVDAAGNLFIADMYDACVREVVKATGDIITYAGTGNLGPLGDGGPATEASLVPEGLAVDAAGDLFIADIGNNCVREVVKATGDIITVAGNGTAGYSGDGGPATSSELSHPEAVAVDAAGNLFIADVANDSVREVVKATGDITTLVTGQVNDLVVDAAGNLFMSNGGGVSERLAATGTYVSATPYLYFPNGLALDSAGDLFIADTFDAEVREVTPAAVVALKLATIASVTASASTVVNGQSDTFTATVSTSTPGAGVPTGGAVTFLDGGTVLGTGQLVNGVATLPGVFLSLGSHSITASYDGDASFYPSASSVAANVAVTSPTVTAILASAATANYGQSLTFTATVSELAPGAAVPDGGAVTFSDQGTAIGTSSLEDGVATLAIANLAPGEHTITASYSGDGLLFGPSTSGTIATAALQVGGLNEGVAVDSSDNVYFDNNGYDNAGTVDELVKATGQVITVGVGISYGGLAVDAAGDIYGISDFVVTEFVRATGQVKVVAGNVNDPSPGETGDGGPATEATLDYPRALAVDAAGNLYIYDGASGVVREVLESTGIIETASGPLPVFLGGAVDSVGDLFYASVYDRMVSEVVEATGQTIVVAGTGSADYNGDGEPATDAGFYGDMVAMDAAGDLYLADYGNARVREITPAAIVSVIQPQHLDDVSGTSTYGGTATLTATLTSDGEPESGQTVNFIVTVNGQVTSVGSATTDSNGLATLEGVDESTLGAGTYSDVISAGLAGAPGDAGVTGSGSLTVSPAPLLITADSQSVLYGAPLPNLTASYSGFVNGDTAASLSTPVTLSTEASSLSPIGTYAIEASGATSADYQISFQSGVLTISPAGSSTALYSSGNPAVFGQSVTFTAIVAAEAPSMGPVVGSVTFSDGSTTLGTATLSGGVATFSTSALSVRAHSISASYAGDPDVLGSTSSILVQSVGKDAPFIAVASSASPSVLKQAVSFTVNVSGASPGSGTPSGKVQFQIGGTNFGQAVALVNGTATSGSSTALALGNHSVTVIYNGDGNFTNGLGRFTQSVQKIGTTTSLSDSVDSSVAGESVTFTAIVAAVAPGSGIPSGTVSFLSGSASLATVPLSAGQAAYTTTKLATGTDAITAVYNGNASFATSASGVLHQTVSLDAAFTTVVSSSNPSDYGQKVTLSAKVTAASPGSGMPNGSVTFYDGSTSLGSVPLNGNGKATYQTSSFTGGTHSITVSYSGDANFLSGTSSPLAQYVNQDATRTRIASSSNPSVHGQSLTFTATVSANSPGNTTPTGSVEFYDGSTVLGTGSVSGGVATFSTSALSIGTHSISADYLGDTNFKTSASGVLKQVESGSSATSSLQSAAFAVDLALDPLSEESDQGSLIEIIAIELLSAPSKTQSKAIA